MKLARFRKNNRTGTGIVKDDTIIVCNMSDSRLPDSIPALLQAGAAAGDEVQRVAEKSAERYALEDVVLLAPIERPGKFLCVGLNYLDHIEETGAKRPEFPTIFNKQTTCIIGPGATVQKPNASSQVDYEGELGIVIGRRCRGVKREQAHQVIGGFLAVNDVSVRDWQRHSPTWTMGKSFDTHGPVGPWLVTADEIGDPHRLDIKTWVNGELRQDSNTRHLLFDCFYLIEYLSAAFTLEPGDIIATGTSGGVGFKMTPPSFLNVGDTVRVEIEDIGALKNTIIAEPGDVAFIA
jgi:2-keto-4-pentenoate hydratase/2-oxohepta-3-ene-1,7-dioic acid hydratase in catechol pathway